MSIICASVLAPVLVPMNVGDIPSHLPAIDDYVNTVPGNTNFPGLLDNSSSTAGLFILCTMTKYIVYVMSSTPCTSNIAITNSTSIISVVNFATVGPKFLPRSHGTVLFKWVFAC